jgi:chemotaxis family two-component system response regulator Rcp1
VRPMNVLVVEDSPADVRLIREALKRGAVPVRITIAIDGIEALDYLHRSEGTTNAPDLMLLDLNLPRKSGYEVLTEVKSSPTLKRIPVLIMTSSRSDEDIDQAYGLNANGYITKPYDFNEYMNVVLAIEQFWFLTATLPEAFRHASPPPLVRAGTSS